MGRIVVLFLVLIVLGLYLGFQLSGAAGPRGRATSTPGRGSASAPATEAPASVPVPSLDAQVAAAATRVANHQPFTVVVTEAEANARLADAGPTLGRVETVLGTAEVRDPRVRFTPGEALLESRAAMGAIEAPLRASFGVSVSPQGRAVLSLRSADLGGVPLPRPAQQQIEQAAQAAVEQALGDLPAQLTRIDVQSGRLVATGQG